jgi:acetyl-CoA carboxylase carboxyl transferase subunit beta
MVDMVVHRHELRKTLANLCHLLTKAPAAKAMAEVKELPSPEGVPASA